MPKKTAQPPVNPPAPQPDATPSPEQKAPTPKPYMVMKDGQGVGYLRVALKPKALFVLQTGSAVELIEMDQATIRSRNMVECSEENILEAARILLTPLSNSVMVSERCKKYLQEILSDKEIITMANEAKTKKAAKKTAKATGKAAPKNAASKGPKAPRKVSNPTIKLAKAPKDGELKGQALAIVEILKENGKKLPKVELIAAIGKKIPSKNVLGASDIWAMNRKKLIEGGFVEEVPEAA